MSKSKKPKTLWDVGVWAENAHTLDCRYAQDKFQDDGNYIDYSKCTCRQEEVVAIINKLLQHEESVQ